MAEKRRRRWGLWVVVGLVLVPVLYLLSIGPLYRWAVSGDLPNWSLPVLNLYLMPLSNFAEIAPDWFQRLYESYLMWWVEL